MRRSLIVPALAGAVIAAGGVAAQAPRFSGCLFRAAAVDPSSIPAAFGWPDLSQSELEPGVRREIRLFHGGGIALNHYALRLRETEAGVTGELLAFWPADGSTIAIRGGPACQAEIDAERSELANQVAHDEQRRRGCRPLVRLPAFEACQARFLSEPPWAKLLQRLDSLGLWSIPDVSSLLGYQSGGVDGVGMEVELRDATTFRRFDPGLRASAPEPVTRRALAVNAVLLNVLGYPGATP